MGAHLYCINCNTTGHSKEECWEETAMEDGVMPRSSKDDRATEGTGTSVESARAAENYSMKRATTDYHSMSSALKMDVVQDMIEHECDAVKELLLMKNREYGNAVFEPINIFASGLSAVQQIDVRIDDKLKRIQSVRTLDKVVIKEDTLLDLIGYLVLRRVACKLGLEIKDDNNVPNVK